VSGPLVIPRLETQSFGVVLEANANKILFTILLGAQAIALCPAHLLQHFGAKAVLICQEFSDLRF